MLPFMLDTPYHLLTLSPCHLVTLSPSLVSQGSIGYTFPENNRWGAPKSDPAVGELWYRGKVNTDSQGRCSQISKISSTACFLDGLDGCCLPGRLKRYLRRYEFRATFPIEYEGRPIIHYHYKVSLQRVWFGPEHVFFAIFFIKVTTKGREFITQVYFKEGVSNGSFHKLFKRKS